MNRWPGAREAGLAVFIALAALLAASSPGLQGLRRLETASLDLRFRLRGVRPPGHDVGVILVDDKSLAKFGRWPFSRHLVAQAIRKLSEAKTRLVVMDLLMAEPSLPSAGAAHGGELGQRDDPDNDLAAAIRTSGNVLLPVAFQFTGAPAATSDELAASAYMRFDNSPEMPSFPMTPVSVIAPVPSLAKAALGLGHINIAYDLDGAPRYDYLALPLGGDFVPSLAVRAAAEYRRVKWPDVGLALGQGVSIADLPVPSDLSMRLLVNYPGPRGTIPTWSFADLITGQITPSALAGRVIVLGASFTGDSDSNGSPFDNTPIPGSERLAAAIDMIAGRHFIRENPWPWPVLVPSIMLFLAGLGGLATARVPTRLAVLAAAGPVLCWAAAAQLAFGHGLWLPLVNPLIALALASLATLMFRYWVTDRDARFIKLAFRHYLAPELVNALAANPKALRLGGETRTVTLLFCDIRGFTTISEKLKDDPQALTRLINRFLTPMTGIIREHRGTIDKYIGDCIMAFWNAPLDDALHAVHACESACAMLAALKDLNASMKDITPASLAVGIGLNSGNCVVGNMGSDQRFAYSALGDAVNLASRLEGQSKLYGVSIVAGEATRALAPDFAFLEIDRIRVLGKMEPVQIYALLGGPGEADTASFKALVKANDEMLALYRAQDWAGAASALARCQALDGSLATLHQLYAQRIDQYRNRQLGEDWDGVFIADSK